MVWFRERKGGGEYMIWCRERVVVIEMDMKRAMSGMAEGFGWSLEVMQGVGNEQRVTGMNGFSHAYEVEIEA